MIAGAALFVAGVYTGYEEGVRADETGTVGRMMPAEVLAVLFGTVLVLASVLVLLAVRRLQRLGRADAGRG